MADCVAPEGRRMHEVQGKAQASHQQCPTNSQKLHDAVVPIASLDTTFADTDTSTLQGSPNEAEAKAEISTNERISHSSAPETTCGQRSADTLPFTTWYSKLRNSFMVRTHSISSTTGDTCSEICEDHHSHKAWKASWFRIGPLSGIFAILVAMTALFTSLAILMASDQATVTVWTAPPSTYLAICTAVANLCLRYACINGVVVAWWYRASRVGGSTLSQLHYSWRSGTTLRGAVTAGRHSGLLALACIFSTLIVLDAPLVQRASTVDESPITGETVHLNVKMAEQIPHGFGGQWQFDTGVNFVRGWSYVFNKTVPTPSGHTSNLIYPGFISAQTYGDLVSLASNDAPIAGVIDKCPGTCKTLIRAPALTATSCASHEIPVDYNKAPPYVKHTNFSTYAPSLERESFLVSSVLSVEKTEKIVLVTGYSTTLDCSGTLRWTTCELESAIGEYSATVRHNTITLEDAANPRIVAMSNNTAVEHDYVKAIIGHYSTLAVIEMQVFQLWDGYYTWFRNSRGALEGQAVSGLNIMLALEKPSLSPCSDWSDPRPTVMEYLNKNMVWLGSIAANQNETYSAYLETQLDPGRSLSSSAVGQVVGEHAVYESDYRWFVAAAVFQLICIAFVLPTYYGFWTLGRSVSFSPLEIAKAFDAPALTKGNSNSTGRDLAQAYGNERVQYGAGVDPQGRVRLAFDHPDITSVPPKKKSTRFEV